MQLCEVDAVRVLFKPRSHGAHLVLCRMDGEHPLSLSWQGGEPNLVPDPPRAMTLFQAAPWAWLALPSQTDSGDPALDGLVAVGGDSLVVAAALDLETRQCLIELRTATYRRPMTPCAAATSRRAFAPSSTRTEACERGAVAAMT